MRIIIPLALAALSIPVTGVRALDPPAVSHVEIVAAGQAEATLLFDGEVPPARIDGARLRGTTGDRAVDLILTDRQRTSGGGVDKARYRFALPQGASGDLMLLLPAGSAFAFAPPPVVQQQTAVAETSPPPVVQQQTAVAETSPPPIAVESGDPPRAGNPFLANLSAFNPTYAAFGRGTNSDGKIQISLKYQLFGSADQSTGDWKEGFRFGYTQRMLWDVGARSAPFRDVNYQPELFYTHELRAGGLPPINLRGGFLHESNGRSGDASRAYNIVYVQPSADVPLGDWTLSVGPRFYRYVFGRDGNQDIARYRGHQALALAIGQEDGVKLSTWSRMNVGNGKGSIDGELSYPLDRLVGVPLYVMVQGFTGYGESLLDYDRRQTRLRLGIAIVR